MDVLVGEVLQVDLQSDRAVGHFVPARGGGGGGGVKSQTSDVTGRIYQRSPSGSSRHPVKA